MERQEFLMEIEEMKRNTNCLKKDTIISLIKEAIRLNTRYGIYVFSIQTTNTQYLTIGNSNIILNTEIIKEAVDYFREEGFTIMDNNGHITISW